MSNIFIISGPSGAGEDSVIRELSKHIDFDKIVTTTTREIRPEDIPNKTYYFISKEKFLQGIKNNAFFEYALEDNGNYYGGTYAELERVKKSSKPVIWKVDFNGVVNSKKILPESKSIFIYIPIEIIRKRLEARGETEEVIQSRLEYSRGWYDNEDAFDFKVINEEGKLEETVQRVAEIIKNNLDA